MEENNKYDLIKIDMIKQEYFKLQDIYEDFDKRIQIIKGWSLTIALASISFGLNYRNEYLGLFASISALICWNIETNWKIFQYHYKSRIEEIEEKIRNENISSLVPLQIYTSWFESYRKNIYKFLNIAQMRIVFMPYFLIFIIGIFFFLTKHYHIINYW